MNKRSAGIPSPGGELRHFTDREPEQSVFQRLLDAPEGAQLPVLMYFGVGGVGKTWLTKRFRESLGDPPTVPSAQLDLDPARGGGSFCHDSTVALAEIRQQIGVECPRFDLAYAMLRHKQGMGDEPLLKHGGAANTAWEFLAEVVDAAASSIPAGKLIVWAAKKVSIRLGRDVSETAMGRRLLSAVGNEDFLDLRSRDAQDIYPLLAERLGLDLEENLPTRAGHACQAVVLLDTFEALRIGIHSSAQQYERERWICDLYAQLTNVLMVIAGRDRLTWDEVDGDWRDRDHLEQHLLGGLSDHDAQAFLTRCGIDEEGLQQAILKVCVDMETGSGGSGAAAYHPFSLGLCADTVIQERERNVNTDPESFAMRPGHTDALAQRFLKSLASSAHVNWIVHLAQTPRFDEAAARYAYSPTRSEEQNSAWEELMDYSFVTPTEEPGWWTLHARMRDSLRKQLSKNAEKTRSSHQRWREYWQGRALDDTDAFTSLAWYHHYQLDSEEARKEWLALAERLRRDRQTVLHYRLLDWWVPTGIEGTAPTRTSAKALYSLGISLSRTVVGNRAENSRHAIRCYEAALRVWTEAETAEDWAHTQNALGAVYGHTPAGDPSENRRQAIVHYEAALRVLTETAFPDDWAMAQNNIGVAHMHMPVGDQAANLARAIEHFQAALRVQTEAHSPQEWAITHHNLGVAYSTLPLGNRTANLRLAIAYFEEGLRVDTAVEAPGEWANTQVGLGAAYVKLPTGDIAQNLARAIECFEAAMHVYNEQDYPEGWAGAMHHLGRAYHCLPTEDQGANLRRAISCYESALRIRTEANYPHDWAGTQRNLGYAYSKLPSGDRKENLSRAIQCFEAALRVDTEAASPIDWAETQHGLGLACSHLLTDDRAANLQRAIDCYEAALRVRTEQSFPSQWARVQNNLGIAYANVPVGDRGANLTHAIGCYEAALRVHTETDFPQDWAMAQTNLANAYLDLPTGNRWDNFMRASHCCLAALRVFTESAFPVEWAAMQHNLGHIFGQLPGNRGQHVHMAIQAYQAALRVRTEAAFPQDWAATITNLGVSYAQLPAGDIATNLDLAIECFEAAIRVQTRADCPHEWARTIGNLGAAYAHLPAEDRSVNFRRAIECYQEALTVQTEIDQPLKFAGTQMNIAVAYYHLGELQQTIAACTAAARAFRSISMEGDAREIEQWRDTL